MENALGFLPYCSGECKMKATGVKTFLVTFVTDHLGRRHTTLRHAESEKAVRAWAKRTKTFFIELKIEEVK